MQNFVLSNYLNKNLVLSNTNIVVSQFDYSVFNQKIYADIHITQNQENAQDTLLFTSNIVMDLNLFDVFFFKKITINQIYLNSPKITIDTSGENNKYDIKSVFSMLSSLDREILLSNIQADNLIVIHNTNLIDDITINIEKILIKKDDLSIMNIQLNKDNSILYATCQIDHQEIKIHFNDSHLNHMDPLFEIYDLKIPIRHDTINFKSLISIRQDSMHCNLEIMSGHSTLYMDFVKKMDLMFANYKSNIEVKDFPIIYSKHYNLDNVNIEGNVEFYDTGSSCYKGVLESSHGFIEFDINTSEDKYSQLSFDLIDVDLGSFFNNETCGKTTSKLVFDIQHNKLLTMNTYIYSLVFNEYNYQNISILQNDRLSNAVVYDIIINDPNLNLFAQCNLNYSSNKSNSIYSSNLSGIINRLDLNNLHYNINDSIRSISTEFFVEDFALVIPKNQSPFLQQTNPKIKLKNFTYNKNDTIKSIDFFNLNFKKNMTQFFIDSEIGFVEGDTYNQNIFNFIKNSHDTPFKLTVDLNQASMFSDIFFNQIELDDELTCTFEYQKQEAPFINIATPNLKIFNTSFSNINFTMNKDVVSDIHFEINKIVLSDKVSIKDFAFSTLLEYNKPSNFTMSYASDDLNTSILKGDLLFNNNKIDVNFSTESVIYLAEQSWKVNPKSKLSLNSNNITFKDFSLQTGVQTLSLNGWINENPYIDFAFSNFNINYFNPFLNTKSLFFDGVLDGDILLNTSSFPILSGNFEVNRLSLNNVLLGQLKLSHTSNETNDSIYSQGSIYNKKNIMSLLAKYPLDGTKNINANIKMNDFPAEILDFFIKPISDLSGYAHGNIQIKGPINDYDILGTTEIKSIDFKIPYLGTYYSGNNKDLVVNFDNKKIVIDNFKFYDNLYNTSATFSGSIIHSALKNMSYDLFIQSDSLYALNTNEYDNENYYGDVFLKGDMFVKGEPNKIKLNIDGSSKEGSVIMIPLSGAKEVKENKFIQFVNNESTQSNILSSIIQKPTFKMDFNLSIDNQSEIQLIFDEELGDLIKGYGEGDLLLKINKQGDFEVFGDFQIEKGNYLFTLQDVITKSFEIERGGMISFNGTLDNAQINLNLLYNVQASLNPLNPDYDRDKKSPIICRMEMTGPLLSPDIDFDIDILNSDQIVETSLESITNTDQKLLEQFLYLLIANSFLIENDPTIDYLGNTLATTGTELLSNQLSNWLSQTTDAFDLGFKWIPGSTDSLSYQQVELAVSKKFLDDRVVINGNVGTPPEQSEANIVGDLDIEYDFFKDGRFKLRVFNRTQDYDPLSESLGYEQGFGIFFKKQFNSFQELFIKEKNQ